MFVFLNNFGMKKNTAIFVSGCICGAFLFGMVVGFRALRVYVRQEAEKMKAWENTDVYSDVEARQAIKKSGIELPPVSWNLFCAINGFQDHGVWISFTAPRDQLWSVIEASIHKKREDFTSGIPENFLDQVELGKDQKVDTSLWTPKSIKNPLHFSIRKGDSYFEDWVVDENGGRIFITKQNT